MLINILSSLISILIVGAVVMLYRQRKMRKQFKTKYNAETKDAVEEVLLPMSNHMIEEGADWFTLEYAMRDVMSDLWMLQGEQAKVLSIIHGAWLRGQVFIKKYGRSKAEARAGMPNFLEHLAHTASDDEAACSAARKY